MGDAAAAPAGLTAVWAQDGADKVARGELRASGPPPWRGVLNTVWDGERVALFGARNETVAFAVVLEAARGPARGVRVALDRLEGPGGAALVAGRDPARLFDWTERQIELFHVGYLPVRGLSRVFWEAYDERHVPARFRRPHGPDGRGRGGWADRPGHDAELPDLAVPLERVGAFEVAAGTSQMIWVDVTIPRDAPPGRWQGTLVVGEEGAAPREIPVQLDVLPFALPDRPSAATMVFLGYADPNERYLGVREPPPGPVAAEARRLRDRHFLLARRHRVSLFDANPGAEPWREDAPRPDWRPRLDGSLYTARNGYAGPGEALGDDLFVVGAYGSWSWAAEGRDAMWRHTDAWARWFAEHAPSADVWLYLADESDDIARTERLARWMADNPGPGRAIRSFATLPLPVAVAEAPSLRVPGSTLAVADRARWESALATLRKRPGTALVIYNGRRPASGTFALEDDGVALRQLAWAQHKLGVDRWFAWESTYYHDYQGGGGKGDVLREARTFGRGDTLDPVYGRTGWRYANGDGVLFYPGTDRLYPASSPGVDGPVASLRLKLWRRGLQDVDYLVLAARVDPAATRRLVERLVPRALWEVGVDDPADPTWKRTDIAWPTDPSRWEEARWELARRISGARPPAR